MLCLNAYYGDLEFLLTRLSGLSTDDFITNAAIDPGSDGPAYFAPTSPTVRATPVRRRG